jgi:hypothetical protein
MQTPAERIPLILLRRSFMTRALFPTLFAAILILSAGPLLCRSQDLSGTWVGETVVPNAVDKDQVTLVLQKVGESYSGMVTDSMGMAKESPLENVKFENDTLTAEFMIFNGGENVRIWMTLKVTGEKLIGNWQDSGDSSGPLELERKR